MVCNCDRCLAMVRRRFRLADQVSDAYYKYAKFCCGHRCAAIAHSVFMVLFLSYPLLSARWLQPSPVVLMKTNNLSSTWSALAEERSWLRHQSPVAHIVQVIVSNRFDKHASTLFTSADAFRTFFDASFQLRRRIFQLPKALGCSDFDMSEEMDRHETIARRPSACVAFSPTAYWNHRREVFLADAKFARRLKSRQAMNCAYELTLGHSGAPVVNDRQWQYAVTLLLIGYSFNQSNAFRTDLTNLSKAPAFSATPSDNTTEGLVHVFYKIRRTYMDYILLVISYVILFIYVYACCQKIHNVKSKWGLAFGAVCTVFLSLIMAAGICVHFQLTRRTWFVELFPYLALLLGMENVLCITRSVVRTPVHLNLSCRLARGLAAEGWYLTRNFCVACVVLSSGLLVSDVPEITEFCTVALVGVFVDFYMQLFFYLPCLAFDLARFDRSPIGSRCKSHSNSTSTSIKYPNVRCPFKRFFYPEPPLCARARSDRPAYVRINEAVNSDRLHRVPLPECVNRVLSLNSPRYIHGLCTLLISGWIVSVAIGVQHWISIDQSAFKKSDVQDDSVADVANWQLYRCWAEYIESLGLKMNARFVSVLKPVRLDLQMTEDLLSSTKAAVHSSQPVIIENGQEKNMELQIGARFASIENRLTLIVAVTCSMFLSVAAFIIYVCFVGGRRSYVKAVNHSSSRTVSNALVTTSSALLVEAVNVGAACKLLEVTSGSRLLIVSSDDDVVLWDVDVARAEVIFCLPPLEAEPSTCSRVWCAAHFDGLIAVGTSDGQLCLYQIASPGLAIRQNCPRRVGITEVALAQSRLVLARLSGHLDFFQISRSRSTAPSCLRVQSTAAHSTLVNCLRIVDQFSLSSSDDRTVRVCCLTTGRLLRSLYAHDQPVVSMVVHDGVAFSSCLGGTLCCWNASTASVQWTKHDLANVGPVVSLAVSAENLLGICLARMLWVWRKSTGCLVTRIKPEEGGRLSSPAFLHDAPQIVPIGVQLVAVASERGVQFWDVNRRMMLREAIIDSVGVLQPVRCLRRLGDQCVVCVVAGLLYRVRIPAIKV